MALQNFATNLTTASRTNITQTQYWDRRLLEMIKLEASNFVFSQLGRDIDIPKNQGTTTMSVARYNSLPVDLTASGKGAPLAEGIAPTPLQPQGVRVQMTVAQYGAFMEITDWVDNINMFDIKSVYQPELARHAAEVKERHIIASFADASEYYVGGKTAVNGYSSTSTDYLTLEDLRRVALYMKNYNRKGHRRYGGRFVAIVHTNVMNDLLDDDILTQKLLDTGQENAPIKSGTLAQYMAYGLNFVETLIAPIKVSAPTSPALPTNVYTSYVLGNDPYVVTRLGNMGVQFKMTGFEAEKTDPLGQRATFGYKMWTGAKVIDPLAIFAVYSVSNFDVAPDFLNATTGSVKIAVDTLGQTASSVNINA
jgi:N4-gp56 family major capsid protein